MKPIEQLQDYFENEIKPELEDLEKWRKKVLLRANITDAIFTLLLIIPSIYLIFRLIRATISAHESLEKNIPVIITILFFGSLIVGLVRIIWVTIRYPALTKRIGGTISYSKNLQNELDYKKIVIGGIIKFISEDLKYTPEERGVTGKEILESEIFPHMIYYPKGYIAEDFVEGKLGDVNTRFFELNGRVVLLAKNQKFGERDGTTETIPFYGMFFIADFNKSFSGHTLVLPESKARRPEWIRASGRKPLKMDDPEFEQLFSVFGTDQIMGRYILSNSLMKRIVDYKTKIGREIFMSFSENKLFIAISHKKNQFEFNMYKSLYDFERVKEFYHDLTIATDIVEDLNLNTQIWLKHGEESLKLFVEPVNHKYRKRWLFLTLAFLFGYTGIHMLYIGYRGKALLYLLITATVFPFLINSVLKAGNSSAWFFPGLLAFVWFLLVNIFASLLYNDSRGLPMD